MACERTSKRVARKAGHLMRKSRSRIVRSVAASALRARERKLTTKRAASKRG